MPTILIGGYYGAGNVGDEAILAAMVAELRAQNSNHSPLSFIVLSWNPEKTSRELDVEAIHWKDITGMVEAARRSDLIIVGGGGIFHDYWGIDPETYLRKGAWDITAFGSLTILARLLDIPCMIYGVGVGPFKSDVAREHTRLAFERCRVATVRDAESLEFLQSTGFDNQNPSGPQVKILPDPVYALTTSISDDRQVGEYLQKRGIAADVPLLGISLHYWDKSSPPEKWLPAVAAGVRQFLEQNDQAQVIGIPFHVLEATPYTNDAIVQKQLAEFIGLPGRVHLIEEPLHYLFVQALIKRCKTLLTMRLHGIIMGINVGTPCVALASRPKIRSAMKMAGLERFCNASLSPRTAVLKSQLQETWDQREELSRNMLALSSEFRQKTTEHARLALGLLAGSHRRIVDFPQEFALDLVRLLQKADEANEVFEKERITLQSRVWELAAQIQNKDIEIIQQRDHILDLLTKVQSGEKELNEQKPHIQELESQAQDHVRELQKQKVRLLKQEAKIHGLKSEVHEQKALLLEQEAQAQIQENNLHQQSEALVQLQALVLKKDQEINQQHNHNLELEALLKNPENEVQRLRTRLAEIESSTFWKMALKYYHLMGNTPLRHVYNLGSKIKRQGFRGTFTSMLKRQPQGPPGVKVPLQAAEIMRAILGELNGRTMKGVFFITSAFVFDEFYNQRVTALAKYLAGEGWGVVYVAWRWSREDAMAGIGEEVYPNIFQIPVDMFLESLEELGGLTQARKYFAVEFPHPEFFVAAIKLRRYGFPILYEILDDWEEFHKVGQSPWYKRSFEDALVLNANVLTAVSQPLVDKFAGIRRDIQLSPNGFNPVLLGEGSKGVAERGFKGEEMHVGYFGHLTDAWFDWDLVLEVVDLARERELKVHFELIGYGNPDLEKRLEKYTGSVTLHGRVQPGELHKYVRGWDVAMIPFKKGKLSQAVDPLKIYEYLWFGLGVIVTGIEHLRALPRVKVVGDAEEFLGALVGMREAAVGGRLDREEGRVAEVLGEATWDKRFSRLVEKLEEGEWMSL